MPLTQLTQRVVYMLLACRISSIKHPCLKQAPPQIVKCAIKIYPPPKKQNETKTKQIKNRVKEWKGETATG